jgi:anti-sigma regulatory factor (Ser/Thr protein kinase)
VELVLRSRLDELPRVIAALDDLMRRHRLPDAALDMHVALDEVLSNIVKYAYGGDAQREIRVRLTLTAGELLAEVEDDGRAFDPLTAPQSDRRLPLAKRKPGGLGISVVKRLMSDVAYTRVDGHNRLTLMRRLDR